MMPKKNQKNSYQNNFIPTVIIGTIGLMTLVVVGALVIGLMWFFNNRILVNLSGAGVNIFTRCALHCQENDPCPISAVTNPVLKSGKCKCECLKFPSVNENINLNNDQGINLNNNQNGNLNNNTNTFLDETANWQLYINGDLGLSFKYPAAFGEITYKDNLPSETGKEFIITFSKNDKFLMGGMTSDFSAGRGGSFLDSRGYYEENGKYYFYFVDTKPSTTYPLNPLKILTVNGHSILLVDRQSFVGNDNIDGPYLHPGEGNLGALLNFTNSSFPGMAVWDKDTQAVPQEMFEKILSTFRFKK